VIPLNSYELMLILRHDAEDQARTAVLDRVNDIITSDEGAVSKVDEWGKRRFAFEIDKMNEGYYYVLYFNAQPKTLDEVGRVLKITDEVVRFMPVRLDDVKKAEPAAAQAEGE
jgi:small subunit ribosomal protein S6